MHLTTALFSSLALLGLSSAKPTPVELAPRACTTIYPTIIQALTEKNNYLINWNQIQRDGIFTVSQDKDPNTGNLINRIYEIVAFEGIPSDAYGCQLNVGFYDQSRIINTGALQTLNVSTWWYDHPENIYYPNDNYWQKFVPQTSPPFGSGAFGTITLTPGQHAVINSEACQSKLAFVFEIASWITNNASVTFLQVNPSKCKAAQAQGFYLTYGC